MKKIIILALILVLGFSCYHNKIKPNFFKNLYTGEVLNKAEFEEFGRGLYEKYKDSTELYIKFNFPKLEKHPDSIIRYFDYDVRIGDKYLIRSKKYDKIGMKVPQQTLYSIDGNKIIIGGKQDKPTLINLWFTQCPGCVAEIPELNRLKEKYSNKLNFIALTFEDKEKVLKFLRKRKFNFTHITDADKFIKEIGSYPFPETIFINKDGYITNIEGGIPKYQNIDTSTAYFEKIIEKIL